jgi:hypothetical protein
MVGQWWKDTDIKFAGRTLQDVSRLFNEATLLYYQIDQSIIKGGLA